MNNAPPAKQRKLMQDNAPPARCNMRLGVHILQEGRVLCPEFVLPHQPQLPPQDSAQAPRRIPAARQSARIYRRLQVTHMHLGAYNMQNNAPPARRLGLVPRGRPPPPAAAAGSPRSAAHSRSVPRGRDAVHLAFQPASADTRMQCQLNCLAAKKQTIKRAAGPPASSPARADIWGRRQLNCS